MAQQAGAWAAPTWQFLPIGDPRPRELGALLRPGQEVHRHTCRPTSTLQKKNSQDWQFEFILVLLPQDEKQRQKNHLEASGPASLESSGAALRDLASGRWRVRARRIVF